VTSGVRNLQIAVAGRRSRRSRSPVRHASSSPRRSGPRQQWEVLDMGPASRYCRTDTLQRQARALSSSHRVEPGCDEFTRPGSCPLSSMWFAELRFAARRSMRRAKPSIVEIRPPQKVVATDRRNPEAFDRWGDYPNQSVARKMAEARMTALDARGLPVAAHMPSSRAVSRRLLFAPQMRGVIVVKRRGTCRLR
jgi:hypothetical protein